MRPIDADIVKEHLHEALHDEHCDSDFKKACFIFSAYLDDVPTIEAEPVKHGKWKHVAGMNSKCSECGCYFPVKEFESRPFDINYCPSCGAKMDGGL